MTGPDKHAPTIVPTLIGLMMGLLVAMLSSSIVSTSLPRIVNDLGGTQSTLTWTVTAALLAITVSTPIWGKLSDLMNRKTLVISALLVFIVGSAAAGLAPDPLTLIVGRAIQGIGAGGLLSLVQIVMADIISPRERGKYMGLFGAVMAVGTIGGPLLGGFITELAGWRWNFFASIPVGVLSLAVVQLTLQMPKRQGKVVIDYAGAALIAAGITGLLVWMSLGGSGFAWLSPPSFSILVVSVLLLVAAVMVEAKAPEPIIPLTLFRNRGFVLTVSASISVGVATYGAAVFMSQYLQLARAASTADSGLITMPQLICVTIASTVVGALISRTGRWKIWMAIGASLQALGLLLLGTISLTTPIPLLWAYLSMVGLGIGSVMQNLVLMAETNVDPRHVGVASAGVVFFRSLGGTIGVTALGAVVNWQAQSYLDDHRPQLPAAGAHTGTFDLSQIPDVPTLSEPLRGIVEGAYAHAISTAYLWTAPLAVMTVVCILLLPPKTLSTKTRGERIADLEVEMSLEIAGAGPMADPNADTDAGQQRTQ